MDPTLDQAPSLQSKIVEFIETLVVFLAIGTAIYLFIAQPHKVSGSSMFPTLKTGDYIITNKVSYRFSDPQRGEIIVFKSPKDADSVDFIKRIIGLPGERVKVENNHIYINGKILEESAYLNPTVMTLPNTFLREGEEVIVPDNHYIVIGDNRMASSDSREWGYISREEIIGQAFLRYWPLGSFGLIKTGTY